MTRMLPFTVAAGVLAAALAPAAAQMDRYPPPDRPSAYDRPYDRYERPYDPYDRPYDRFDDRRPRDDVYQGMRTGPVERRQGNVIFTTGGVTKDEAEAFRAAMPRYALGLEFARANGVRGDFLAYVEVSVTDMRGQPVLHTVAEGPFLLADLPAGQYTVRAASEGSLKTRTVNITPGRHQYLAFTW
ncbi:carboxypeptidase-like regulatory domain-containing protein [Vineibacter terrae]|uniref:carboxypeptidase-like regulatory domain-containing protein n=1 Tax=Vineibacter terrae TaxID=2586908 RepID=UPI002E2FAB40|nr:carboxypeptidase-like regulatory domain-containing protein [Vineibacter terrae]HEX2888973.1 carboxypeptidase-like regulatory domain-containing protein [Vineibacter terrae]